MNAFPLLPLLILFPFGFCLDSRGVEGGTILQFVMVAFSLLIFIGIFLAGRWCWLSSKLVGLIVATGLALIVGVSSALLNGTIPEHYLRIALPYGLLLSGMIVGGMASISERFVWSLYNSMIMAGFVSVMFRYYFATEIAGIGLEEMRYQLLSPANGALIAYIISSVCFMRSLKFLPLLALAAVSVPIFLSLTRSAIISAGCCLITVPWLLSQMSRRNPIHGIYLRGRVLGAVLLILSLVVGLSVASQLRPMLVQEWYDRIFEQKSNISGYDITFLTRLSEAKWIWEDITASGSTVAFGRGFGTDHYWSLDYINDLKGTYGANSPIITEATWYAGHSAFTYAFFFGGVFGLCWQLIFFVLPLKTLSRCATMLRRSSDDRQLRLFFFVALSLMLSLADCLTANPFGERMTAEFIGIDIGILLSLTRDRIRGRVVGKAESTGSVPS